MMKMLNLSLISAMGILLILISGSVQVFEGPSSALLINWELASAGGISLEFPLFFDKMSLMFSLTVLTISSAVLLFAKNYMAHEKFYVRFHLLVMSFIASMLILIFSPSLISLLMGWDGLGITSYLLVIYFQSPKSLNAGMLTALTNRVGDCLILISIALFCSLSMPWVAVFCSLSSWPAVSSLALCLLVCAAFTKSAQVPFSAWLPAAMAAPTPVSSLVHSSTLVTAGVYLLCRYFPFLGLWGSATYILPVGVATMLMAGLGALFETDMKKIIALSTLSQLGLMVSALGISLPLVAFFHLLTHAFFKALLFMTVGNLIHLSDGYQDSRKTGFSGKIMAPTLIFSLVANLSLMGLPFLAGFYSKDLIMEACSVMACPMILAGTFYGATALTAAYTVRFGVMVLAGGTRSPKALWVADTSKELPLANLFLLPLAVAGGSLLSWVLFPLPAFNVIPASLKNLTSLAISAGILFGLLLSRSAASGTLKSVAWGWGTMWALPLSTSSTLMSSGLSFSVMARSADLTWKALCLGAHPSPFSALAPIASMGQSLLNLELVMITLASFLVLTW